MLFRFFFIIHLNIIPFGKFRPPHLGKATAAASAALLSPTSACWVFSCFRNPQNSDMDYRIFNVRTWSVTQGLGTLIMSRHNIFDFEKLTNLSCAPDGVRTAGFWIVSSTLYQLSHPVSPRLQFTSVSQSNDTNASQSGSFDIFHLQRLVRPFVRKMRAT